MTPGSCSTGIHILLEELELIFEVYIVNLLAGDHQKPEFLKINPKASIPVLVTKEGNALTDFQSIAWWLAHQYPKAQLLPSNFEEKIKVLDTMSYVIHTIHMQGFARIFTVEKFTPNEKDYDWVKEQGKNIIEQGFAVIAKTLMDRNYIVNDFSIADAALFYIEFWADKINIKMPEACQGHYQRMLKRPVVKQVLREEGYSV